MSMAKITLIGLENFLNCNNMSIFDFLELPEKIDKITIENSILMELGEYEPLWSDAYFFRNMVGVWSKKWQRTFDRWSNVLSIDYNPLENYDRMEEWTDDEKETSLLKGTITGNTTTIENGTNKNDVSAFNDANYQPNGRNTIENNSQDNSSSTSDSNTDTTRKNIRTGRSHGNIGVTTSQQMLESELNIAKFNIYEGIVDIFASEFCLLVED